MASPWIEHVKKVAKEKNLSFKDALRVASKTFKKGTAGKTKKVGKKMHKKNKKRSAKKRVCK